MKRLVSILLAYIVFFIFFALPLPAGSAPSASIEWNETTIDFGEIAHNKPVIADFRFKNPGMVPIMIHEVESSCGCTVADFPQQPIPAGAAGAITVTFDAKEEGYFAKTITVHSNAQGGLTKLYIKGIVVK